MHTCRRTSASDRILPYLNIFVVIIRSEVEPVYVDLLEGEGVDDGESAVALLNISLEHAWVAEVEPDNGMVRRECSLVYICLLGRHILQLV